jgi:hypothetical protein
MHRRNVRIRLLSQPDGKIKSQSSGGREMISKQTGSFVSLEILLDF